MSRLPSRFAALLPLAIAGCMHQPMYQPYPYGQPMYAPQNGFNQPGTLVVPPAGTAPYEPGGSTFEGDPIKSDDFKRETGSGTEGGKFFGGEAGGVPPGKDPGTDSSAPFSNDISVP